MEGEIKGGMKEEEKLSCSCQQDVSPLKCMSLTLLM